MKYFLQTFGCQMNKTDSERITSVLEHLGYKEIDDMKLADLVLFNSCSIRKTAEDRVHGGIANADLCRKENPRMLIGVTGCMVRKSSTKNSDKKDKLLSINKRLDFVLRIEDLGKLDKLLLEIDPKLKISPMEDEGTLENYFKINPKYTTKFKAYVPIQSGCDKFCTYCIVPFTRGREYSRDFQEILNECEKLVLSGTKEITLVGQTVNTYGISKMDKISKKFANYGELPFVSLLQEIDKLKSKGLKWLRFTSPHPKDFSDELIETLSTLETMCPYIHMPIQSGCDPMLKAMNRNYNVSEYVDLMNKIKNKIPDIAISTDIIVGFCGETKEMFEETYRLYEQMEWDMCYHAKYSSRKGTYSEKFLKDDVKYDEKNKRWHRLNQLIQKISYEKHKPFFDKIEEVLVDSKEGEYYIARNKHNKTVRIKSERNLIGEIVCVRIVKVMEWLMDGELV